MPRRRALTEAQLENLLALPVVEADLIRHWTLADADLAVIERRRGGHNQLGYALQEMMRDPIGLFLRAGARVGRGHVKLGALAVAKARELPVLGLFAAKPGEDVTADPLRVALLLAVGMLDPESPQAAEGAELRFG